MPLALELYARDRPDLQALKSSPEGSFDSYVLWWLSDGRREPFVGRTSRELCQGLSAGDVLPAPLPSIWRMRPDLQSAFRLDTGEGREAFIAWWGEHGRGEYPSIVACDAGRSIASTEPEQASSTAGAARPVPDTAPERVRGINVIGFAGGVLGIGEDARMATTVVRQAGFEAASVQPGLLWMPKRADEFGDENLRATEHYPVSLFCLPPTEMIRLALEGSGALVESPTYKIGAWPWELPHWPADFNGVVNLVDEIWAQSRFVAQSYAPLKAIADVDVHHVPLSVQIPSPTENVRQKYNLPADRFLFYVMFDGNSWLTRKNPLAGVLAFQKAFSGGTSGVGLVIKAMNIRPGQPMWEEITRIAARDSRIHIISETLSRQEVINLMASCDAYVSLHRSEGFGRVIAESMLLGQPTIVTNFSGNVDFCTEETSFLVNGDVVPLVAGDYIFAEGQYWCDPDIDEAAQRLREVLDDAAARDRRSAAGKRLIESAFSVEAVCRAYRERLDIVFEKLAIR